MDINTAVSAQQNMINLLNSLNPSAAITSADVLFGTPAEVSATSSVPQTTPTTVGITGTGQYEGDSVTLSYNRVDINFALANNAYNGTNLPAAQTANYPVSAVVNANWGVDTDATVIAKASTALGLVPGEIAAIQNIANLGQFNHLNDYGVMANPSSLLYVGNADVLINWQNYMPPFNGMTWITNTQATAQQEAIVSGSVVWVTDGTNMYSINQTTGNISAPYNLVTGLSLPGSPVFTMNCIDSNGVIWMTNLTPSITVDPSIVRFDTTTGAAKDALFVNPTTVYTNLEFDPINNVVWALSNTSNTYGIAQLNVTTGAVANSYALTIDGEQLTCFFVDTVNGNLWLGDLNTADSNAPQVRVISNTGTVLATLANQGAAGICLATNGGTTEIILADVNPSTSNMRLTRYSSTAYTVTLTADIANSVFAGIVSGLYSGSNVTTLNLEYMSATDEILLVADLSIVNGYTGSTSNSFTDDCNGTFTIDRTTMTNVSAFYPSILNGQVRSAALDSSGNVYLMYLEEWSTFDDVRQYWLAKLTA